MSNKSLSKAIKNAKDTVKSGNETELAVFSGVSSGKLSQAGVRGKPFVPRDVANQSVKFDYNKHLQRILLDADPVGFLMDIMNGKAIQGFEVEADENGNLVVNEYYVTPKLRDRVEVARWLAERYMPKVGAVHLNGKVKDNRSSGDEDWDRIVGNASFNEDSSETDDGPDSPTS